MSNIGGTEGNNTSGIFILLYQDQDKIVSIPDPENNIILTPVQVEDDGGFFSVKMAIDERGFKITQRDTDAGILYDVSVEGFLIGENNITSSEKQKLRNGKYNGIVIDNDGVKRYLGDKITPMRFSFPEFNTGEDVGKGRKGTSVRFSGTFTYEPYFYESTFQYIVEGNPQPPTTDFTALYNLLMDHINNTSNPHGVTKNQIGLGNVNNTSDADKPVSTAQQAVFDLKVNKAGDSMSGPLTLPGNPTQDLHAVPRQYVLGITNPLQTGKVNKSGQPYTDPISGDLYFKPSDKGIGWKDYESLAGVGNVGNGLTIIYEYLSIGTRYRFIAGCDTYLQNFQVNNGNTILFEPGQDYAQGVAIAVDFEFVANDEEFSITKDAGTGMAAYAEVFALVDKKLNLTKFKEFDAKQNALNGTGFVKITGTTISYDNTSYLPLEGGTLTGALTLSGNPTNSLHATTKSYVDTALGLKQNALSGTGFVKISGTTISYDNTSYLPLGGGTLTGALTLAADPTNSLHAATKSYVDNLITGITWKNSVLVATTANITLSGTQTIDGVAVAVGNRVLVKNQTIQTENGIYVVSAGAWTRSTDADTGSEIETATVFVEKGTANKDTQWTCTATDVTIGSTNITFGQIAGAGTYSNGTGLNLTGNVFSLDLTRVATSSVTGLLSSADWTTFNNKQNALSGTGFVKISGTTISYDNSTYVTNVLTTAGDLIYGGVSGVQTRLPIGTRGRILQVGASSVPEWNANLLDTAGNVLLGLVTVGSAANFWSISNNSGTNAPILSTPDASAGTDIAGIGGQLDLGLGRGTGNSGRLTITTGGITTTGSGLQTRFNLLQVANLSGLTSGLLLNQPGNNLTISSTLYTILQSNGGLFINSPIANTSVVFRINNATIFQISSSTFTLSSGIGLNFAPTYVSAGTTGNQTINRASGNIRIAAGNSSVVLTNSLISSNSIVIPILHSNDTTAKNAYCGTPGAGSITIFLNAAATAEVDIRWIVIN